MNWRKIKAEYIAGGISQRAIAEKYGISQATVERRAKKEKWTTKRREAEGKSIEKVTEKKAEAVADNALLLEKIKTGILTRLADMVANYPDTNAGEVRDRVGHTDYIYRLKDLAAVYESLSDKLPKGQSPDIEDLTPLGELLKDE